MPSAHTICFTGPVTDDIRSHLMTECGKALMPYLTGLKHWVEIPLVIRDIAPYFERFTSKYILIETTHKRLVRGTSPALQMSSDERGGNDNMDGYAALFCETLMKRHKKTPLERSRAIALFLTDIDVTVMLVQMGGMDMLPRKSSVTAEHFPDWAAYGIAGRCHNPDCMKVAGTDVKLRMCAQCKVASYCCKGCQASDWKARHKHNCTTVHERLYQPTHPVTR